MFVLYSTDNRTSPTKGDSIGKNIDEHLEVQILEELLQRFMKLMSPILRFSSAALLCVGFVGLVGNSSRIYATGTCGDTPVFTPGNTFGVGTDPRSVVAGDFNGDGKPDIVVASFGSNYISVMLGDGAGGFGSPSSTVVGNRPTAIETGDFNADNKIDIAVSAIGSSPSDARIVVLLGSGTGSFGVVGSFGLVGLVESIAVADFNNDGKADLALADQYNGGRLQLRFGDGTGQFTGSDSLNVGGAADRVISRDFNADGKWDLATTNTTTGSVVVFINNGAGGFPQSSGISVGSSPAGLVAADFNGDGKLDLAVANKFSRDVALLRGNGSGGFVASATFPLGKELTSIATSDFNADGKPDLAVASHAVRDVTIIMGNGTGGFGAAASFDLGPSPTSIAVEDFNQDGKTDIVASRDGSSALIAILLNSCGSLPPTLPGISVGDVTMPEGNDINAPPARFTLTLSSSSAQRVTVSYATSAGTASPGPDFDMVSGVVAFDPGETAKTVLVPILGETLDEYDETFNLTLSNPIGGTIVRGVATCTLLNDDPPPTIAIVDSGPIAEGDAGNTTVVLGLRLNTGSPKPITVDYSTADNTAIAGSDYQASSGSITFAPGETFRLIAFLVNGDTVNEATESFFVNLSNPVNVAILDGTATVTIVNDDSPAVQSGQISYNIAEDAGRLSITVSRAGDPSNSASVDYATSDTAGLQNCDTVSGKASQRCDYATTVGTLRFAPGERTKTILIPIVNDSYAEGSESFMIKLSNPVGAALGSNSTATVIITDNDATTGHTPIDQTDFFILQQYIDFLGREPDAAGLTGWRNVLNQCGISVAPPCDRIEASAGFFRSPEFQDRGYFIYRFYSAVSKIPLYSEFIPDLAKVSGFLSAQELEANKMAFISEFMTRQDFQARYGALSDPTAYVEALLQTLGFPNHPGKQAWIVGLTSGSLTRPQVLRAVAETGEVYRKYYNEAFVIMQYFGYLRRSADISYLSWIQTMDQTGGDYRIMINGFLNSAEYRNRFGN
ncbi:MAG: hypothetical protein QOJ64_2293 [Acidobacteriota bacterium]|nr:hypothetical protein [Acidobacteriota bacterium]